MSIYNPDDYDSGWTASKIMGFMLTLLGAGVVLWTVVEISSYSRTEALSSCWMRLSPRRSRSRKNLKPWERWFAIQKWISNVPILISQFQSLFCMTGIWSMMRGFRIRSRAEPSMANARLVSRRRKIGSNTQNGEPYNAPCVSPS